MSIRTQRSSTRFGVATIVAALIASLFAFASPAGATQNVVESRVAGPDRYATAAAVAQATFTAPQPNIILASGENFPDGLAAAGLAGAANAPVLLTTADALPSSTANALGALFGTSATKTVHVMGGTAAISAAVEAQLTGLGYTVNRVSGADRYATAAAIAQFAATIAPVGQTFVGGFPLRTAIVATGENFPDALAAGAPAYSGNHPILLTESDALSEAASGALTSLSVQRVIVMGGTAAVSEAVVSQIQALGIQVTRVSGADRGATAAALAGVLTTNLAGGGFDYYGAAAPAACLLGAAGPNIALVVSGTGFADALAAGPHAGNCSAPILIAGSSASAEFLTGAAARVGVVRAIGGTAAVSAEALTAAKTAATQATPTATISTYPAHEVVRVQFSGAINAALGGQIRLNNTTDLCAAVTAVAALPVPLVDNTCYIQTSLATGNSTLTVQHTAPFVANDVLVATGFQTTGTSPLTISPTSYTVTTPTDQLTATVVAAPGSPNFTVTFSRPVGALDGAQVIIRKPGQADAAPATFQFADATATAIGTVVSGTAAANFAAGDVIIVQPGAATATSGAPATRNNLAANLNYVVPALTAGPTVSALTSNLVAVGGVLNTTGVIDTNIVIQADAARPDSGTDGATDAGVLRVALVDPGANNVPLSVAVNTDATTGVTTVTVTLATGPAGAITSTSSQVAAALNANATASTLLTATASNPTSVTPVTALGSTDVPAGTRTLQVTTTWSKALAAAGAAGDYIYDPAGNAFTLIPAASFGTNNLATGTVVLNFNLGVGVAQIPAPTAGVATLRVPAATVTAVDTTTNANVVRAFS